MRVAPHCSLSHRQNKLGLASMSSYAAQRQQTEDCGPRHAFLAEAAALCLACICQCLLGFACVSKRCTTAGVMHPGTRLVPSFASHMPDACIPLHAAARQLTGLMVSMSAAQAAQRDAVAAAAANLEAAAAKLGAAGRRNERQMLAQHFAGTWLLCYSSAFESGNLGGSRPGPPASIGPQLVRLVLQLCADTDWGCASIGTQLCVVMPPSCLAAGEKQSVCDKQHGSFCGGQCMTRGSTSAEVFCMRCSICAVLMSGCM